MSIISISAPTPYLPGYKDLSYIGVGGSGTTFYATSERDGRRVVIKEYIPREYRSTIPRDKDMCIDYSNVPDEITDSIKRQIKHENEIYNKLKQSEGDGGDFAAIFPVTPLTSIDRPFYAEIGTFNGEILSQVMYELSLCEKLVLFEKVLQALKHFHSRGIVHMDFNARNMLLVYPTSEKFKKDNFVAIFDYGSCVELQKLDELSLNVLSGSVGYMSPEVSRLFSGYYSVDELKNYIGINTDLYAYAIVLLEAILGAPCLLECCLSVAELKQKIQNSNNIPAYFKRPIFKFLSKLIYEDASELSNRLYDNYYHNRDDIEATYRAIFNDLETLIKIVKSEGVHPAIILAEAENIAIKIRDDLDPEKGFIEEMLPDIVEVE